VFQYEYDLSTKQEETEELRTTIAEQKQQITNLMLKNQRLEKEKAHMEAQYKKQIQHYSFQVQYVS
jgi:hypothetical protein